MMVIGQLALSEILPEKRALLIEKLLEQVKRDVMQPFAGNSDYLCGIRSVPINPAPDSPRAWTLEWVCNPMQSYLLRFTPLDAGGESWQVELTNRGPFSRSVMDYPRALGYCTGLLLRKTILGIFGKIEPNEGALIKSATEQAITPRSVTDIERSMQSTM